MANKNPDPTIRRENGTPGNGHGYGHDRDTEHDRTVAERGEVPGRHHSTAGTSTDVGTGRVGQPDTGGRYYTQARGRGRESYGDDRLMGMGYAASGRGGRGFRTEGRTDYRGDVGRDYRGDYRRDVRETSGQRDPGYRVIDHRGEDWGDRGYEGWTGGFSETGGTGEYEHGRRGFRDFGTPSTTQGREIREHYTDRDFAGRDERYAGRSGSSFHPEQMGASRQWVPPEEQWERTHPVGGHGHHREPVRHDTRWEREACSAEDVMTANPKSVRPEATLKEVAQIMRDENCGVVPVVSTDRRLVGLITDRDMVMRSMDHDRAWTQLTARDVMTDEIEAVTPDEPVREIVHLMGRKQVRRVPVVDRQDRLLGMIAMADIANRADRDEELQEAMHQVSRRRSFWKKLWS